MNSEIKKCVNCRNEFVIEPEDFDFYKKIDVPPPTFCFHCRLRRRMIWRNLLNFYKRKCDLCKKDIISTYPEDFKTPVYCPECWWSDKWDPYAYGREYDFSRPFFSQFQDLLYSVPMISIMNDNSIGSVGSEYSYDFAFSKNAYMCTCGWHDENTMYSYYINYDKDVVDCYYVNYSENMYECIVAYKSARCSHCSHVYECNDCHFSHDLRGCSDCILCVGLRNKKYCIRNIQYTRDEYEKIKSEMEIEKRSSFEKLKKELAEDIILSHPQKYSDIVKSVSSTGNVLSNCKNTKNAFYVDSGENSRYVTLIDNIKDSYDVNNSGKPELCYECITPDESYGCVGTIYCWRCHHVKYSNNCHSCEHTFGSVGVKKGSYVILNRKYSKEEYKKLYERIVENMRLKGEWGEFFPKSLSPYAYNETEALEWFPISSEKATDEGYKWRGGRDKKYSVDIRSHDIPDAISGVSEDICGKVIECKNSNSGKKGCTTAFKIVPQELLFYKRMKIPIPDMCPGCRYTARSKRRNPIQLWHRKCMCGEIQKSNLKSQKYENTATHEHGDGPCPNEFETSYASERPEIVYCEECYQKEIL